MRGTGHHQHLQEERSSTSCASKLFSLGLGVLVTVSSLCLYCRAAGAAPLGSKKEKTAKKEERESGHGSNTGGARCKPSPGARPSSPRRRELTFSLGMGGGGARVPSLGWFRTDAQLSVELGVAIHPRVQVRVAFTSSVERFWAMLSFGGAYLPLNRRPWGTPYIRGAVDVLMAGAGVQPGLTDAVGYAWWSPWPLGLYAEARASGRLTTPRVFELVGSGGVFVYF